MKSEVRDVVPLKPKRLSITTLKGVGPKLAERLHRLGLYTAEDVLLHLPLRYQDRSRITPIGKLQLGEEAQIEAAVVSSQISGRSRRFLLCRLSDGTGDLTLRFFHFSAAQQQWLSQTGTWLRCFGEVRSGYAGGLEMIHPECRRIELDTPPVDGQLTPIYPATAGLQQFTLRNLAEQVLEQAEALLPELLPPMLLAQLNLPPIAETVRLLHQPPADTPVAELESGRHPARRRLAFEEMLAHQLSLRRLREQTRRQAAPPLASGCLSQRFLERLPFTLTAAQQRVLEEINADLMQPRPMLRLLQGDVGSGKTVVAAAAALRVVAAGAQAALMAPTELLAEQHHRNFRAWLGELGLDIAWLTGRLTGKARQLLLERLAAGEIQIAIGTHALFQETVEFAELALVIVDEQHRFGVHQRLALREKGRNEGRCPHQLIMTATPIPRTLAMSAYADLDTSIIDELPPGRRLVKTVVVPDHRRNEIIERIRRACRKGRQAYWVCPLIEESEALQCQAATVTAEQLTGLLPELRIGLVHGRLSANAKETVMAAFKAGELALLVATTVIEVGVDVPNASLMVIENPERLGLAQLHQLRGRIGRGSIDSSCVLLYRPPLSQVAQSRLAVLRECHDGFEIARRDLELRGPGEVLGTRQTGEQSLRIADLLRDQDLLNVVRHTADLLLRDHPDCVEPLIHRWIGAGARYGEV
ncbi:MAG TPA: ATP-dependent DNA helicase RecG [Candidatus Competibacteraceae bacterium]|nr:ATP-dependent DNA helicase RecG [Candidatus Competibacteraceae bacterium]MCP5134459.1 ATP-dependent DNA helicase RecG [Gammaproteobacteria bacterium]HPF58479.1 ATP-dependent DNA helicase RecG [Candidatus Competibacteraceae bacterium]